MAERNAAYSIGWISILTPTFSRYAAISGSRSMWSGLHEQNCTLKLKPLG